MEHEQNSLIYKTAFSYRKNKQGKNCLTHLQTQKLVTKTGEI